MIESLPDFAGTLPGWITSAAVVGILGLVVRWQLGLRRLRIEADQVEVSAHQVDNDAADKAAGRWMEIERRVSNELEHCRQERQVVIEENFRFRIVLTMVLDEIERLDPGSHLVAKARAILSTPPPPGRPNPGNRPLGELLEELDLRSPTRPREP